MAIVVMAIISHDTDVRLMMLRLAHSGILNVIFINFSVLRSISFSAIFMDIGFIDTSFGCFYSYIIKTKTYKFMLNGL